MAYNAGAFSLFNQSITASSIVANYKNPTYQLRGSINSLATSSIAPSVILTGGAAIGNFYAEYGAMTLQVTNSVVTNAYTVFNQSVSIYAGTISNAYSLYVTPASGSGTIQNNFSAYFDGGGVGLNTSTPINALDVAGNVAVGTFAGVLTAPTNNMIIAGPLGVQTSSPTYSVQVMGQAGATRIYSPGTTQINQLIQIAGGVSQGAGSTSPGTQLTMSAASTTFYDSSSLQPVPGADFQGGVFDGRYLYKVPVITGQVARYDTMGSLSASTSYAYLDLGTLRSGALGFQGGVFDGRYVYFIPFGLSIFARYDTTAPFAASTSYSFLDLNLVTPFSGGFAGAVFDGRYLYMVPYNGNGPTFGSGICRYDTTSFFTATASYSSFDLANVRTGIGGFWGGTFDGRYVYFAPNKTFVSLGLGGYFTRFDTSQNFSNSLSYAFFNFLPVNSNAVSCFSASLDGRYIYLPNAASGIITRYDTKLPFSSSISYEFFNTGVPRLGSSCFDGRYLYIPGPFGFGIVTRYDVTRPFSNSLSYSFLNVASLQSLSSGIEFAFFDGRYVYFTTYSNSALPSGLMTRIQAYSTVPLQALNCYAAPNGLTLLGGGGISLSNVTTQSTATSGAAGAATQVQGYYVININGVSRKIPFYAN